MVVISSSELRSNMEKYLDLARRETVLIQRGKNETFVLTARQNSVEYDLLRPLSDDEALAVAREEVARLLKESARD